MSDRTSQAGPDGGLWGRLRNWLFPGAGKARDREPRLIQVWDAGRARYRDVDLDNPHDSLWPAARELANLQARQNTRPAA